MHSSEAAKTQSLVLWCCREHIVCEFQRNSRRDPVGISSALVDCRLVTFLSCDEATCAYRERERVGGGRGRGKEGGGGGGGGGGEREGGREK